MNKRFLWVSCAVIVPKSDVSIYTTHDAHNVKMAIISTNHPISKQEDMQSLKWARYFSEVSILAIRVTVQPDSCYLTAFLANYKAC